MLSHLVRIGDDLYQELSAHAKRNDLNVTAQIRVVLWAWIRAQREEER
jgi:hypothetical protein